VVVFHLAQDLAGAFGHPELVSCAVGPAGEAVLLGRYRNQLVVLAADKAGRELGKLVALWPDGLNVPVAQRLPDGSFLVVARRSRRMPDGSYEPSAIVYDTNGNVRNEFVLGDGIEDVQVTSDGHIWVSYFDEGVYGNLGWSQPLGSSGLTEFDSSGKTLWSFSPPDGLGPIDDCYALNAARPDGVYAYYYSSFPIVRIGANRRVQGWRTDVEGARALAVDGDRVLLLGGYAGKRTRAVIGTLGGDVVSNESELPASASGPDRLESMAISARGSILHGFVGTRWYQFDMRSLASQR